tara:strand:- start:30058 stop:30810 length:753 start_codon:yes stop_codon:yes gene_type:complete
MSNQKPNAPEQNNVQTFYEHPTLDRLTGHYTVEWENSDGTQQIKVHNRITDLEGHAPSLFSLMRLPKVVKSYRDAKRHPILPEPVPFLVLDAIAFLEQKLEPGMRVLEIGGGNSTLWFLAQGCEVHTIEHSPDWAEHMRGFAEERLGSEACERMHLHVEQGEDAIAHIESLDEQSFDIVLVDCMNEFTWRKDCVRAGRSKVKPGGWMCLDNSDHPNNWNAAELMLDKERIRFTGWAPMCSVVTQTSFWQM